MFQFTSDKMVQYVQMDEEAEIFLNLIKISNKTMGTGKCFGLFWIFLKVESKIL